MREVQDTTSAYDSSTGHRDLTDYYNDLWEDMDERRDKLRRKMKQTYSIHNDIDVKSALRTVGWEAGNDNMRNLIEWLFFDAENGNPIEHISAVHNIVEDYGKADFGGEERFVTDKRGFCKIFESLAEEINLLTRQYRERLNYPPDPYQCNKHKGVFTNMNVTHINYQPGNVMVTATNNANGQTMNFEGDAIVCTASVGVLRAGLMQFNPPLPQWKCDAL